MRHKPPLQPYKVLDIGCGEGKDAVFLARNGYEVSAFDSSEQGITKARELAENIGVKVDFFKASLFDIRLDTSYDIIFSSGVFHYIPQRSREDIINDIKSHTKDGGINAINVFVKKPYIADPADMEAAELSAGYWKSGELFTYYHDWLFHSIEERIFDCNSGGVPHKHCMDVMIAQKEI